jgi:hypothetical protein
MRALILILFVGCGCTRTERVEIRVPVVVPSSCLLSAPPDLPGPIFQICPTTSTDGGVPPTWTCLDPEGSASLIVYLAAVDRWVASATALCGTVPDDAAAPPPDAPDAGL